LDDFLGASMDDKPFWTNDLMPPLVMGLFGWMLWWFMDDGPFAESWILIFSLRIPTWVASTVRNLSCAMTDTNSKAGWRSCVPNPRLCFFLNPKPVLDLWYMNLAV
jgi:hypothetical protein